MRVALLLCVYAALGWSALAARCAFALCAVGSVHASDSDCVMMCSGVVDDRGCAGRGRLCVLPCFFACLLR